MIGNPSAGKLHAGFDEGGLDGCLWATGHETGNGGYSQGFGLKTVEPVLYSTSLRETRRLPAYSRCR